MAAVAAVSWESRAGAALLGAAWSWEPSRSLWLSPARSLARWLASRSLTARRPALALPTRGGGKRRPGAAPPTAHARRASVCMCARARAAWSRSAPDGDARGASLGPVRCAAQSWTRGLGGSPVSPANSRGRRSGRGPGDAQPRKKPGGAGPSPPPPASFSSLFLCFLLPLFSPPLLPLVVPGLLLSPPSSTHSCFPAHAFLFLGWKLCPGGIGHGAPPPHPPPCHPP